MSIADKLAELIKSEGIHYYGISDARIDSGQAKQMYRQWIAEERHGEMAFMETHEPMKYDPEDILKGTQSIIVLALGYYPGRNPPSGGKPTLGKISNYARGRDYHREFGKRLKRIASALKDEYPNEQFRAFTDTAPLHERLYAQKAGVAFTGKNTLSLHRELGSYFFLGEILSTLALEATPLQDEANSHCPGGCTRCIDVCPTKALEAPFRIDASKCISYLTIEHKGSIEPSLRPLMGNWIFGCDLCQEVCPFNIRAQVTDVENFLNPIVAGETELADILAMENHEDFTAVFAGTPVMRAGRVNMVRNSLIAAANSSATSLVPRIRVLCGDTNEVIAETALWALEQLTSKKER